MRLSRRIPSSMRTTSLLVVLVLVVSLQHEQQQAAAFSLTPQSLSPLRHKSAFHGTFHGSNSPPTSTLTRKKSVRSPEWRRFLLERRVQSNLESAVETTSTSAQFASSDNNTEHPAASPGNANLQKQTTGGGGGVAPPFTVTLEGDDYSYKDAIMRTLGWVGAATIFGGGLWAIGGSEMGEEFFAGYMVEQSLSVDNLFVFLLLFEYFNVPLAYQDRVLNWGIYGAIVMRAVMIGLGAAALTSFHEILLVFAAILVYGSAKFFYGALTGEDDEEEDPSQNSIVRLASSIVPSTEKFDGDRFFTMMDGIRTATPLLICMVAVEISDVVFAVDSIPAVFGVTENPVIVFSSNLFAIMGLRSLYTILSKAATDLIFLEPAVALVLGFIGSKMIAEYFGTIIPTSTALGVVATLLSGGIGLSVWDRRRRRANEALDNDALEAAAATMQSKDE